MDPKITGPNNGYNHGDMPGRTFLNQPAVITAGSTLENAALAPVEPKFLTFTKGIIC